MSLKYTATDAMELALTYDDVQLVPNFSQIKSRMDVNLGQTLLFRDHRCLILPKPFFSASMDTVTEKEMATAMYRAGGLGVIHRFMSVEDRLAELTSGIGAGVAVGLNDTLDDCAALAGKAAFLSVDVAHAHTAACCDFIDKLRQRLPYTVIMAGNVCTKAGARDLADAGADIIKVGTGSGSVCSTREVNGFGIPSITAIAEAREATEGMKVAIVADGGIRKGADIAKALAAGAHAVMLGSLLAGTDEAPGDVVIHNNTKCKVYRGMASGSCQADWHGLKEGTAEEGVSVYVPTKGLACNVINRLAGGLRSALSYAGAEDLKEFYENTRFVRVTQAGVIEAKPHIKL